MFIFDGHIPKIWIISNAFQLCRTFRTNDQRRWTARLSDAQFRRFMNIIYQCGVIKGVNKSKKHFKGTKDAHKLDIEHFLQGKKLTQTYR